MATKVNTRFVVILSAVLLLAAGGVLGLLYSVLYKSAAELAAAGDRLAAAGEYEAAARQYSKAVNKEQTNPEWLRKWRDALLKLTPTTTTDYEARYDKEYMQTLRQLALIQSDSLEAQHEYLGAWLRQFTDTNASRASWEFLASEATASIARAAAAPALASNPARETLKRYRAIPRMRIYLAGLDLPSSDLAEAVSDAGDVLRVDPKDYETAFLLAYTHMRAAALAGRRGETTAEENAFRSAREVAEAFAKAAPEHPGSELLLMSLELEDLRRSVSSSANPQQARGRVEAAVEMLRPRLREVAGRIRSWGAEHVDANILGRFQQVEQMVDERGQSPLTLELARWALESRPDSSDLLLTVAGLLGDTGEYTEAIAYLERLVNLSDLPLSWAGLKRRYHVPQAMAMAADFLLRRADTLEEGPERAAAVAQAKAWRDRLAQRVPADSPALLLIDGGLRAMNQDWLSAKQLLTQYNSATNNADPEGLLRLAVVHMRVNEPGEARRRLQQSLERRPDHPRTMYMAAELELQLRNFEAAAAIYERLASMDPSNPIVTRRLSEINAALGKAESEDPVIRDVIAAARKADGLDGSGGGDLEGAIRDLQAAVVTHNYDMRVVGELIRRLLEKNDRAGALQAARAARQARPDDPELRAIEAALAEPDPIRAQATLIRNSSAREMDKKRALLELYARNGRVEEAEREFAEAVAQAPDEPWVLEMSFMRALGAKDYARAETLGRRAAEINLDRMGGRTFRARIAAAKGSPADAVAILREGLDPGTATPEFWRLLGRMLVSAGRTAEAVEAFQRAVAMRPSDVILTKDLITALMQQDRRSDALAAARAAEKFAGGDLEFFEMLMILEQSAGDKNRVVQLRERLRSRDPSNRANLLGLASVYLDLRQFDKARAVIDSIRRESDGLDAVTLDARWYADRADYPAARRVFAEYISALPDDRRTAEPYLAYATFMFSINDVQTAYVALLQARRYQSASMMEADKGLGDFLIQNGRWDEAVAPFERVVKAGADDEVSTYTKRLIEAYIRSDRAREAQAMLDRMGPAAVEKDVVLLLLTGEVAAANNDLARQQRIINRAIELFPTEPMAYLKRAQLARGKPDQIPEAIQDLSAALRIQPNHWQSLRLRADLYLSQQKWDEAFADLRAAIRANPRLDELRAQLIDALMDRGRLNEAIEVADEALTVRPNDLALMVELGDRFAAMRHWAQCVKYYRLAWEQTRNPIAAQKLLDGLLLQTPPLLADAEVVLRQVGAEIERNPGLLMARGKLSSARGRMADAKKDATTALRLIRNTDVPSMSAWFAESRRMITDQSELLRFYEQLQESTPTHRDWMRLMTATVLAQDPSDRNGPARAVALLETWQNSAEPPAVRRQMLSLLSTTLYHMGRYERVEEVCRLGLRDFPDDAELLNNLAFTLAKHLNRPDEALPLAEVAVRNAPPSGRSEALDTLGYTQYRLGMLDQAEATLFDALQVSRTVPARFASSMHLGLVYAQKKNRERASALLAEVERMMAQYSFLDMAETRADLEQLRRELSNP
jgi:tetratricopeptide (TPR) repeat protein